MKKLLLILIFIFASCDKDDNQINLIELDLHITQGQLVNGFVSEENYRISSFEGAVSSISFKVYPHTNWGKNCYLFLFKQYTTYPTPVWRAFVTRDLSL